MITYINNNIEIIIYIISLFTCWYIAFKALYHPDEIIGKIISGMIFFLSFVPYMNITIALIVICIQIAHIIQTKYINKPNGGK